MVSRSGLAVAVVGSALTFGLLCSCQVYSLQSACGPNYAGGPCVIPTASATSGTSSSTTGATSNTTGVGATSATTSNGASTTAAIGTSGATVGSTSNAGTNSGTATNGSTSGGTTGSPGVLSLCPQVAALVPGDTLLITASIPVSWTGNGTSSSTTFSFTASATGTFLVKATAGGQTATTTITVANVPTLSGTVAYQGNAIGQIYVAIENDGQNGGNGATSVSTPGAFEIRNPSINNGGGTNTPLAVYAFMDTLGTATYNSAADPFGSVIANWTGNGTGLGNVMITLTDPPPINPLSALDTGPYAFPGDSAVFLVFPGINGSGGGLDDELADHYHIYVNDGGSQGLALTIPASSNFNGGFVNSLVNGQDYTFAVAGVNHGTEGPLTWTGPITVGVPDGGSKLSGSVDLTAFGATAPGTLYVIAAAGLNGGGGALQFYFDRITSPSGTEAYNLSGVTDNTYAVGAILDTGGGVVSPTSPSTLGNGAGIQVVVTGIGVSVPTIVVPAGPVNAVITTQYQPDNNASAPYQVNGNVASNLKLPVNVALVMGPDAGFAFPTDLSSRNNNGTGFTNWGIGTNGLPTPPVVGDNYVFNVTYLDGTTCSVSSAVTGVFLSTPNLDTPPNTTPISIVDLTMPLTFSWTPPSGTTGTYTYELSVNPSPCNNCNGVFTFGPSNATTTTAPAGIFDAGSDGGYEWNVDAIDQFGNSSQSSAQFATQYTP